MKKSLMFLIAILISSCGSYKKYTHPSNNPLTTKLHSLKIVHTQHASIDFDLYYNVFDKELTQNVIEVDPNNPVGILEITQTNYNKQIIGGWGYIILNSLSSCTLTLLGLPLCTEKYCPEYDFVIYDIKGNIVANYTFSSSVKRNVGLYRNYNKQMVGVHKNIINQFKESLQVDATAINDKLIYAMQIATDSDIQNFKKKIIELRKNNNNASNINSSNNINNINNTFTQYNLDQQQNIYNPVQNQQKIHYGRSREQIMADIRKHELLKRDFEGYLENENSKTGSNYSPTRANTWNMKIIEVNKKLQQLNNELRNATY